MTTPITEEQLAAVEARYRRARTIIVDADRVLDGVALAVALTDVPDLVAEVRRLRALVAQLHEQHLNFGESEHD